MKKMDKILTAGLLLTLMVSSHSYAQKPVYALDDAVKVGSRVTYKYLPDSQFHVNTKMGFVTDIELKPGETITYIAGGDTSRWLIDKAVVANVQHVYIKPIEKDIKTNVIVNTNLHSYRLEVSSGDNYDPLVTFDFDDNISNVGSGMSLKELRANRLSVSGKKNFDYRIKAKKNADVSLMPAEIFDDGVKTYIRMPDDNKYDLPVIYNIDPWDGKTLSMVNYRRQGDYFVIDRVMEHGRLFYHQKFYIDFYNEAIQKTQTKEYRQKDTLVGRMREAIREEGDAIRDDVEMIAGRSSNKQNGIRVYNRESNTPAMDEEVARREQIRQQKMQEAELQRQEQLQRERAERLAEQQRLQNEQRAAQEKQMMEARRKEQARLEKEQRLEAERKAEQQRLQNEQRAAQEKQMMEARRKEQARLEKEQRLEAERKAEQQRLQNEQRAAREKQMMEARRKEQARLEKEQRLEAERKAEAARQAEEKKQLLMEQRRVAAEKERIRQEELRKAEEKKQLEARRAYEAQIRKQQEAERLRQEELRRQEAKRIAEEQKARAAAEKERLRQEELRKQELKRQQEEAAKRKEMIRLETEKRNAEIARLTELENKKLEELRNLQAKKQQQINDGQATINRIARTGSKESVARPAFRPQNAQAANASQVRRQPAAVNRSQGSVPQQKSSDPNLRSLDSMYAQVENSSRK